MSKFTYLFNLHFAVKYCVIARYKIECVPIMWPEFIPFICVSGDPMVRGLRAPDAGFEKIRYI